MPKKHKTSTLNYKSAEWRKIKKSAPYVPLYALPQHAPIVVDSHSHCAVIGFSEIHKPFTARPILLLTLSEHEKLLLQNIDKTFKPSAANLCMAACVLKQHNVTLELSALILNIADIASVSRIIALQEHIDLLKAMDEGLTLGHTRVLKRLAINDRKLWIERALAAKLSITALSDAIKASTQVSNSDIQNQLSQALNTNVILNWPAKGTKQLSIEYFSVEELQGTLQKLLTFAGSIDPTPKAVKRKLVIELTSLNEFDALLGNVPKD